jgi:hypothetical protein
MDSGDRETFGFAWRQNEDKDCLLFATNLGYDAFVGRYPTAWNSSAARKTRKLSYG